MFKKLQIKSRNKRGAVLVEFALAVPLLLGILFFIIEIGNLFYLSNSLQQIARTSARYAATTESYSLTELKDYATKHGSTNYVIPDISKLSVSITPAVGTQAVGDTITVTISYTYSPLILNPMNFFGSGSSLAPTLKGIAASRAEVGA